MDNQNFTATILVDQNPQETFNAITNVRGWWSENIEGRTGKLDDVFFYSMKDLHHCTMKLVDLVPDKKAEWLVLNNYFNFTTDQTEWKNTKISFEITEQDDKTQIHFTHIGLVPGHECYDVCFNAWTGYISSSLHDLITTGKGHPNAKES
jgi:hypothetical protein